VKVWDLVEGKRGGLLTTARLPAGAEASSLHVVDDAFLVGAVDGRAFFIEFGAKDDAGDAPSAGGGGGGAGSGHGGGGGGGEERPRASAWRAALRAAGTDLEAALELQRRFDEV
jgi:hypothetical protein